MPDSPIQPPSPLEFMADAMLGRLARWLRILGYDTAYEKIIEDDTLIARAIEEHRWLLTRDSRLVLRKLLRGRHTLIISDHLDEQLRQLRDELHLPLDLSVDRGYRCADCNQRLVVIPREEAVPLVPHFVAQQYREFLQCPRCRRVFWQGTHWERLQEQLAAARKTRSACSGGNP